MVLSGAIDNSFNTVIANRRSLSGAIADHPHIGRNIQAAWCLPSALQDVARNTTQIENIAKLDNVSYASGIWTIRRRQEA